MPRSEWGRVRFGGVEEAWPTDRGRERALALSTCRFQVIVEQDEDALYVADVLACAGCGTQGARWKDEGRRMKDEVC